MVSGFSEDEPFGPLASLFNYVTITLVPLIFSIPSPRKVSIAVNTYIS